MLGKFAITTRRPQSGLDGLRAYLDRLQDETDVVQWSDCYFPGCMCGIARLALTPEITLNCDVYPGASCDNLPGCLPEFSSSPWDLSEFYWDHDEVGASSDLASFPGATSASAIESMAWYTNGMGFTLQGVGPGVFMAFDVGQAYSLEEGVTYAGAPPDICVGAWDHQWVDDGKKIVTVTSNPLTIRVYDVTNANDPMAGINTTPLSTLVINSVRAGLQDDMPGVKIHMINNGSALWMWCSKDNEDFRRRLLYIRLTSSFDVSSEVYNRLSQGLYGPSAIEMNGSTIASMDFDAWGAQVVVLTKSNPSNPADNGTLWKYDICSHQEDLITCGEGRPIQSSGQGEIKANLNNNIRAAHINPNGSSIFIFGAGTQGIKMYKASFGAIETNCDIWNIFTNADFAPVVDTGYSPVFYGWTEAGGTAHKFYSPKIFSVCPTATPSNSHFEKYSGLVPYTYEDTGAGVTAGEINYPSSCFGTPGGPHYTYFSTNVPQSFLITGVTGSYIDLPALSVSAQDADGNNYQWHDYDPSQSFEGNKVWMIRNLQTRNMYTDEGSQAILQIPGNEVGDAFLQEGTKYEHPAFYVEPGWSSNGEQNHFNATEYGMMYNWKAAHTEGICPVGWHVPTDEDWAWLEENEADLDPSWLNTAGSPQVRGNESDSGYKTMDAGRAHWISSYGYRDNAETGETYLFDTYANGFFWSTSQGSFADQNYPFRKAMALWAYDEGGSKIHWWYYTHSGIGMSNLGENEVMASIRCKLNDNIEKLTSGDGVPEWTRGPGGVVPPIYINMRGDYQVETKWEYCKSVGCTTVISFSADHLFESDATWMYQFNGTKWELYNCITAEGGHCTDPRQSMYIECGGCDGLMASNDDAYNTCQGPIIN